MPRRYPVEFRQKVLDLIEAGRPVAEVADQLGVTALRNCAVDGLDRRLLRQRNDGVVLGSDAGRALEPETMANPTRAGERRLRIP